MSVFPRRPGYSVSEPTEPAGWRRHLLVLHPLLAGLYSVVLVWRANADLVDPGEALGLAGWVVLGAAGVTALGWVLTRSLLTASLVATPIVLTWTLLGRVADHWPGWVQLATCAAVPLLALAGVGLLSPTGRARVATFATVVLAALVVTNSLTVVEASPWESATATPSGTGSPEERATTADPGSRDVWVIVPDRYAREDVLSRRGAEPTLTRALRDRGFSVLAGASANYQQTRMSLASAWSLDYPELAELDTGTRRRVLDQALDRPPVAELFQQAGYDYWHLGSWVGMTADSSSADQNLGLQDTTELVDAWRLATALPGVLATFGLELSPERTHRLHAEHQLSVLHELSRRDAPGPQLVMAHVLLPHEPFVFSARGGPSDPQWDERQAYDQQRRFLDRNLLEIVDRLLARPTPPAIVIASDEGLYPSWYFEDDRALATMDARERLEKFGIMAAVHHPVAGPPPDDASLVNIMRWLVSATLDAELPPVEDRFFLVDEDGEVAELDEPPAPAP